jgi:hypothetical protein
MSEQLTLFAADFPARTSPQRDWERVWTEPGRDYGVSMPALLASWNLISSSWKTSQLSLDGEWTEFSETWPRSGTMHCGIAYQLPPLVLLTDETEYGFWLTPTVQDAANRVNPVNSRGEPKLSGQVKIWPHRFHTPRTTPRSAREYDGESPLGTGGLNPTWVEWLMGFPIGWTDLSHSETP